MPSRRHHWRALAGLGALLMVICVWPFACAAMPVVPVMPPMTSIATAAQRLRYGTPSLSHQAAASVNPSYLTKFLSVLNVTTTTTRIAKNNELRTVVVVAVPAPPPSPQRSVRRLRKRPAMSRLKLNNRRNNKTTEVEVESTTTTVGDDNEMDINASRQTSELNLDTTTATATTITTTSNAMAAVASSSSSSSSSLSSSTETTIIDANRTVVGQQELAEYFVDSDSSSVDRPAGEFWSQTTAMTTARTLNGGGNATVRNYRPARNGSSVAATISSHQRKKNSNLERNERSANLSHITGTARKIQLLIKNRLIQILPDGTVNGTQDDGSDYTILQRGTVDVGQIKIQGVATCLFLCMDACGNVYGTKEFTDDCIFNETMQENYNIYSSTSHSTPQKTFYLALNKMGQPRKMHLPAGKDLGKLATYAKALTFTVAEKISEALIGRTFGINHVKHGLKQLCDSGRSLFELTARLIKHKGKCGKKHKNKSVSSLVDKTSPVAAQRKGSASNALRCSGGADEGCASKKRRQNGKGRPSAGGPVGGGPKNAKKHKAHVTSKKNQRKRKLKESVTSTTTDRQFPYTSTASEDDGDGLDQLHTSSTETALDDDDDWDGVSMPSAGITSFVDDDMDDFET